MADQEFYGYLNDLQARSKARRWWTKALVVCAVLGGIYGAMIGSAIATSTGAANVIGATVGTVAFLLAFPGARYGFFFGMVNHVRFGRLFIGTIAAIVGAILGGYLGLMFVTPLGVVILGAVGGSFFMQAILSIEDQSSTRHARTSGDGCKRTTASLDELHDIIQIAMGWDDEHMFAFVIDGKQYGDLERGGDFDHDSRSVRLSDLAEQGHTRFQYDYDFGDGWKHVIEIEKTLPVEEGVCYPRCVKGERACPPEDSGGPYGYPYFLEKLQDPKHEEHEETLEWVGDDFDPEEFDLEKVNEELRYLRRFLGHGKGQAQPGGVYRRGFGACESWDCPRPISLTFLWAVGWETSPGLYGSRRSAMRFIGRNPLCSKPTPFITNAASEMAFPPSRIGLKQTS